MLGATPRRYIVASDVGGTCTDTIVFAEGEPVHIGKALSTPPAFGEGVVNSVRACAETMGLTIEEVFAQTRLFVHGSTVVDNTVLTRDGALTGLVTTAGFEDTLAVTRGAYGRWAGLPEDEIKHPVMTERAAPLVPADRVCGVPERIDWKGAVVRDLDDAATESALRYLVEQKKVEAVAVCFLWSVYNPAHERRVRDILRRIHPEIFVTLSSEIAPVPGEYERTSTTVINAYAGRITRSYLNGLETLLSGAGYTGPVMIMQGYGGLLPAKEAAERAVGLIECGPAAGVIGAKFLGELMGDKDIIAADMGGTTFKVGVIQDGEIEFAREPMVDRFHYVAPKIEVVSIGAGGGSIVSLDPKTRVPLVGPRSAGARPGPICYGQGGTEPTLTDVLLLIGYMDPGTFLGGTIKLDVDSARRIFKHTIADPLGMSVEEAAFGIYRVASAQITDLIHEITVERGLDPRDYVLHAFGGSCGLLCGVFGQELNVRRVVVPYTAAVNCAFGLVAADIVHEYSVTKTMPAPAPAAEINALYAPMIERAKRDLAAEGFAAGRIELNWSVDFRYSRQVHEVNTPVRAATPLAEAGMKRLMDDFEQLYERKYGRGSAYRDAGMEMTLFRLSARGLMSRPTIDKAQLKGAAADHAKMGRRKIFVDARSAMAEADIYDFGKLEPGNVVSGPAVIHTPITTIVLQDQQTGRMDAYRNVVIEFGDLSEAAMDPITFSIIRHRLFRVVDEAVITLKHVSGSAITNEGHDLMVSLYRADGSLLMGGVGFLHHLTSAAEACKAIIRRFKGNIHEGDVYLLNDPYTAALHTSDIYLVAPIHYEGMLVAWSACFVHVYDIGAMNPGGFSPDSQDIFTEGISSPGLKLVDRGEMRQDVLDTLLNMVRSPEMVTLDIRSMIACNNVARDRMVSLIKKYGYPTVDEACATLIEQSEKLLRARLAELPDGQWQSRQYMDVKGETAKVCLTMTKTGDSLVFDFTGSSPQSKYALNCTKWASLGGLFAPLFPLLCYDITWNEGVIRPITMIAPAGTIVNCTRPAPVSVATVGAIQSVNNAACATIGKMLAASEKYRKEATAVWHANHFAVFMFGTSQRGGLSIGILTETFAGAGGARTFADGVDVGGEIPNPISRMANVETMEATFPLRYLFRRRLVDSGGPGKYRGGLGMEIALTPHDAPDGGLHYVVSGKGAKYSMSEGLAGGFPGAPNRYVWVHNNEAEGRNIDPSFALSLEEMPARKEDISWGVFPLMGKDTLYVGWNGGGGFGDPLERDAEQVRADVEGRFVTAEAAHDVYGVVTDAKSGAVDLAATKALRERLRGARLERRAAE